MQAATLAEPLFSWSDIFFEYAGFLSQFAMLGAAGFWLAVARPWLRAGAADAPMARAARTAAGIGFAGALWGVILMLAGLARRAAEKGTTFGAAASAGGQMLAIQAVLLVLLVLLFAALRLGRARGLWPVATVGVFALVLRNAVRLQWTALVNPLHVLGGGLWIGTLAVLAITAIPMAVRGQLRGERGGPTLAQVVARFSALALGAVTLLIASGLVTAWRHLKQLSALWTTPYGYALIAKLCVVAVVFLLGAFNWRRVSPRLGADGGAGALERSSRGELAAAAVVLAITALLVSLPAPRRPGDRPPGPPPAGAAASPVDGQH